MADVELQKAQEAQQAGAELQEKGKDVSKLLSQFGGFNAIRGFMPDADNMNPARKAAKDVFLKDKRFKDKRENLKREISRWLELLDQADIDSATGYADACKKEEEKYTNVLKQGITDALYATQNLERSYREHALPIFRDKPKFLVSSLDGSSAAVLGASAVGWDINK